jgi:hypothetical protein
MNREKIRKYSILHFEHKFAVLYPDGAKNFNLSAKVLAMTIVDMPPKQAPFMVLDFLIWHTHNFNLMEDFTSFDEMVHEFFERVRFHIYEYYQSSTKWWKQLYIEITSELVEYIEGSHFRYVEEKRYGVKDVEEAAGCARRTVHNYSEKFNFTKDEDGEYRYTASERDALARAIKMKVKSLPIWKIRPEFRYQEPPYDPYYTEGYD